MVKSIQQFIGSGVENLEKIMIQFAENPTKIAEMVYGITEGVTNLGLNIIAEELELYDEILRDSGIRKKDWCIVRRDETSLLTSLGTVTYHKTLFKHKRTGKYAYLLDQAMGLEKHARMTEDAEARILEEAVESSYRKGGENASISYDNISKQTVMNKIRSLDFPELTPDPDKKSVPYLYIDCDEDHVALQYAEEKGDLKDTRGKRIMPKIVYLYEGIESDSKRHRLINTKYFGGMYEGSKGVEKLWQEVWDYIENSYDVDTLKKVYINGDGAGWIKSGTKYIPESKFVLDKFHLQKYIIQATSHLWDSVEDAQDAVYRALHRKSKDALNDIFDRIIDVTDSSSRRKAVEEARIYLINNWAGIKVQFSKNAENVSCSAEGHVSHVYADRMSSRPLGWSKEGVDKMSRLRIYRANKRNMLDLVRYQKSKKEVVREQIIYSSNKMLAEERRQREALGELAGLKVHSIPYAQVRKILSIRERIFVL